MSKAAKLPTKKTAARAQAVKKASKKIEVKPLPEATPESVRDAVNAVVKDGVQILGTAKAEKVRTFPTGSIQLDEALGVWGWPLGRIVEIFGPESSGKTTIALHAVAECQRVGGVAAFIDMEHAFDPVYAKAIGVDLDSLLFTQPMSAEEGLQTMERCILSGARLVVVDSVAALTPKAELDGEIGDSHVGLQARLMGQTLRKVTGAASASGCTVIFINQLRHKIGVLFGSPETTPGGNALKYYASIRLDVRRREQTKDTGGELSGNLVRTKVVKNKVAPPFREAMIEITWGVGIDRASDILQSGVTHGVITRGGSTYSWEGGRIGVGRIAASEAIRADEKLADNLSRAIRKSAKGGI